MWAKKRWLTVTSKATCYLPRFERLPDKCIIQAASNMAIKDIDRQTHTPTHPPHTNHTHHKHHTHTHTHSHTHTLSHTHTHSHTHTRAHTHTHTHTVIPRLTSDPANDFSANEDFFRCFLDSANECFSGCAR